MKLNTQRDERVVTYRRKIQSDAYMYLIFYLTAVLLIKIFILKAPWQDYATELLALLGANLYIGIRNIYAGNDIMRTQTGTKHNIILSLFSGLVITGTNALLSYHLFGNKIHFALLLLLTFLTATCVSFVLRLFWLRINKKRIQALEEKFDEDE